MWINFLGNASPSLAIIFLCDIALRTWALAENFPRKHFCVTKKALIREKPYYFII